jgi:hypothetical protein
MCLPNVAKLTLADFFEDVIAKKKKRDQLKRKHNLISIGSSDDDE